MNDRELHLGLNELWGIQHVVKVLTVESGGVRAVPGRVVVDGETVTAPLNLRQKVNAAILELAASGAKTTPVNFTSEELWVLDGVLNREMGDWAATLLLSIFKALDELSCGIPFLSEAEREEAMRTGGG